jgi:hypothetical protein
MTNPFGAHDAVGEEQLVIASERLHGMTHEISDLFRELHDITSGLPTAAFALLIFGRESWRDRRPPRLALLFPEEGPYAANAGGDHCHHISR